MRIRARAMRVLVATMLVGGLFAATATSAQATHTSTKAKLTLVHGIAGNDGRFAVDISIYRLAVGSTVVQDVTYGTVSDPIRLDAGLYWIGIRPDGAPRYSKPVLSKWIWLGSGADKAVVAHLSADGTPRLSVYRNDMSNPGDGNARITIRHNAAVGPVDVFANGGKVVSGLANPYQAKLAVPADTYRIRVALANGGPTVLDAPLSFAAGTNTFVYATLDQNGNFNPLLDVRTTR
jgi:hypothetical protein